MAARMRRRPWSSSPSRVIQVPTALALTLRTVLGVTVTGRIVSASAAVAPARSQAMAGDLPQAGNGRPLHGDGGSMAPSPAMTPCRRSLLAPPATVVGCRALRPRSPPASGNGPGRRLRSMRPEPDDRRLTTRPGRRWSPGGDGGGRSRKAGAGERRGRLCAVIARCAPLPWAIGRPADRVDHDFGLLPLDGGYLAADRG